MKRLFFFTGMLLLMVFKLHAQTLPADGILGVWQSEDKATKIEYFKTGNTYAARLIWAKDMFEADGKTPRKDVKNPDEKLRTRPIQNIVNVTGLTFKDGEYTGGKLYVARDGNSYDLKAKLKGTDKLEARGYKGIPMMGKTIMWTRIQ
jgi:uncharacterized protein (DUF2147 family)